MAAEVDITRQDSYLFVHVQGDPLTPEERQPFAAKILGDAAKSNLDIVVHEDTRGMQQLTVVEYIGRANYLGVSEFKKRIAYVPPAELPREKREFIANAAWNEGRKVRLFSRVEDAIAWIKCPEDDTDA